MSLLLKTPFKTDSLETDPYVYGLRPIVIKTAITELYNDKSILITGPRGIGKSSLRYQLQKVLQGSDTLLKRCALDVDMEKYITIEHVCSSEDTLESIIEKIINCMEAKLEEKDSQYRIKDLSFDISFFGAVKTKLNIEKKVNDGNNEMSLVDALVSVVKGVSNMYVAPHINIAIDELDQLDEKYNIAHFIKVVLETLNTDDYDVLSFILVGQDNLYKRLYSQQPAFARLVKHIILEPLADEYAEMVLDACLKRSNVSIGINYEAKELLLDLSGGYPYYIQKLGHETFNSMLERYEISIHLEIILKDVLDGLKNTLIDAEERYKSIILDLNDEERNCIWTLADMNQNKLPFVYDFTDIMEGIPMQTGNAQKESAREIVKSLIDKQVLMITGEEIYRSSEEEKYRFNEEMFRVYLNDRIYNKKRLDYED